VHGAAFKDDTADEDVAKDPDEEDDALEIISKYKFDLRDIKVHKM